MATEAKVKNRIEEILNQQIAIASYELAQLNRLMLAAGVRRHDRRDINRGLLDYAAWAGIEVRPAENQKGEIDEVLEEKKKEEGLKN